MCKFESYKIMRARFLLSSFFAFFLSACAINSHSEAHNVIKEGSAIGSVDGEWLKTLLIGNELPSSIRMVDIRNSLEFQRGHLAEATNIESKRVPSENFIAKLPKNRIIILTCDIGVESKKLYERLVFDGVDVSSIYYFNASVQILPSGKYIIRPKK